MISKVCFIKNIKGSMSYQLVLKQNALNKFAFERQTQQNIVINNSITCTDTVRLYFRFAVKMNVCIEPVFFLNHQSIILFLPKSAYIENIFDSSGQRKETMAKRYTLIHAHEKNLV